MNFGFSTYDERVAGKPIAVPRAQERALMLSADFIVIPVALWVAVTLKQGRLPDGVAGACHGLSTVPAFGRAVKGAVLARRRKMFSSMLSRRTQG